MNNVKITELRPFAEDDRGRTYEFDAAASDAYLLAFRKKGSVSGNHWHEGKSKGKNPETLLLVSGTVELHTQDLKGQNAQTLVINAPAKIQIPAFIFHRLTAISDCCFLEFNSLEEHKADTKYP